MLRQVAKAAIRFYQRVLSPLFGARCKYYPTCSAYAYTAFDRFGFFGGFVLSAWRILRCNPFSRGGIDYVPERFLDAFQKRKHKKPPRDGEEIWNKPHGEDY